MDSMFPRIGPEIEDVANGIDQLTRLCERLQHRLIETEDALVHTRRAHATWVIECIYLYDHYNDEGPIYRPNHGVTDPEVLALVLQYGAHQIDNCSHCGRRAPMLDTERLCAWGCTPRILSTLPPAHEVSNSLPGR